MNHNVPATTIAPVDPTDATEVVDASEAYKKSKDFAPSLMNGNVLKTSSIHTQVESVKADFRSAIGRHEMDVAEQASLFAQAEENAHSETWGQYDDFSQILNKMDTGLSTDPLQTQEEKGVILEAYTRAIVKHPASNSGDRYDTFPGNSFTQLVDTALKANKGSVAAALVNHLFESGDPLLSDPNSEGNIFIASPGGDLFSVPRDAVFADQYTSSEGDHAYWFFVKADGVQQIVDGRATNREELDKLRKITDPNGGYSVDAPEKIVAVRTSVDDIFKNEYNQYFS
ncbi:MAG: hypothetical protein WAW80_05020 [Candidatus Saccharimonadales bacterium]